MYWLNSVFSDYMREYGKKRKVINRASLDESALQEAGDDPILVTDADMKA